MSKTVENPTSIRLTPELREQLVVLAEADGRNFSNYVVNVLRLHVEQIGRRPTKSRKT